MGKQLHVRMRRRKWAVKHADAEEALASFDRRDDAVKAATDLAKQHDAEVVVFGLDDKPIGGDGESPERT